MNRLVTIGEAAKVLGVSITTLRRWQEKGKLIPVLTEGGHRRYDLSKLMSQEFHAAHANERTTIAYARVSNEDQRTDLERQKKTLELYCAQNGWTFEIVSDLGSGINCHKKGLRRLLNDILAGNVGRLVITHKDRLLRFGADLVFAICEKKNVEVVILNKGEDANFEEDLADDMLEMISVFSARLYGSRSRRNQKILDACRKAVEENG
ncbi:MAG: IS607 family transposase [Desulfovibrio sp.]|nr:IS607 family transposase [Desulfovibrio sp.]